MLKNIIIYLLLLLTVKSIVVFAIEKPVLTIEKPTSYPSYLANSDYIELMGKIENVDINTKIVVKDQYNNLFHAKIESTVNPHKFKWHVKPIPIKDGLSVFRISAQKKNTQSTWRYLSVTKQKTDNETDKVFGTAKFNNRMIRYEVRNGRAIMEGDIDIGDANSLQNVKTLSTPNPRAGLTTARNNFLWPKTANVVRIPYTVTSGNANVPTAVAQFNAKLNGFVLWLPRTTETDYVDFNLNVNDHSGSGISSVGRMGGKQQITGSVDLSVPTLLHEMGHSIGLYHEQSRADRDAYVTLMSQNTIKSLKDNFNFVTDNVQKSGLYDFASIMHYQAFTFSKNGEPTIETIPPGIPLSELNDFSAGDIDGIKRLYQLTPSLVTITSNPPGLNVLVDGSTITTPQTFNFAINSVHTLDVPTGAQNLLGTTYTYGRWSDNFNKNHTITISPGNGLTANPSNKPAVTVYQANFIELVPYAPTIYPTSSGSITPTPAPQNFPPATGSFYVKRQKVTLQAKPSNGYSLYRMYTAYGAASLNPKVTRNPDWVLAYFTPQQKTTITTAPTGRWLWIDGNFWEGPVSWSPFYPSDGDWSPGTIHNLNISISPQLPFSWSIRYPWLSWSDSGGQSHNITVASTSSNYTANFGTEYNAFFWAQQGCAGQVTATPSSPDGFYSASSNISFQQTPNPGWIFTGWQGESTGSANPITLPMIDERLLIANYNTALNPLAITSLIPAAKTAGQTGFTLTIRGTGFTVNSRVFINGFFRASTFVNTTQLTVGILASEIQTPGAIQIDVDNVPTGTWPCSAYAMKDLYVTSGAQPLMKATPTALNFTSQKTGTASLPQTIILKNSGSSLLALHDIIKSGKNPADFSYISDCSSSLAKAGGQCTLNITFQPTGLNQRTARILVLDTAVDSPQIITLTGIGVP